MILAFLAGTEALRQEEGDDLEDMTLEDPAAPEPEGCVDDADYTDTYGDGCEWYDANPWGCGDYGGGNLDACCAC